MGGGGVTDVPPGGGVVPPGSVVLPPLVVPGAIHTPLIHVYWFAGGTVTHPAARPGPTPPIGVAAVAVQTELTHVHVGSGATAPSMQRLPSVIVALPDTRGWNDGT